MIQHKNFYYKKISILLIANFISIMTATNFIEPFILLFLGIYINYLLISEYIEHKPFVLINIFQFIYLIYLIPYYLFDINISDHFEYQKYEYITPVLCIHICFLSFLYFFLKKSYSYTPISCLLEKRKSNLIFYVLFFTTLFSILFLFRGETIYFNSNSYSTYVSNLGKESGLPEYLLVIFPIIYIYASSKFKNNLLFILLIIYMLKLFLLGYRVQMTMGILMMYLLFFDIKFKPKSILVLGLFGFVGMSFFGMLKEGISNPKILELFFNTERGFILSHHTGVLYSSAVYIGLISDEIIERISLMIGGIGFLINFILPGRFVRDVIPESQIHQLGKQFASYGGGGLPEVYIYVYFGITGVILLAYFLSKLINYNINNTNSHNIYFSLFVIVALATFPRWLSYDPANFLFRLPLYCLVIYFVIQILSKMTTRSKFEKNTSN